MDIHGELGLDDRRAWEGHLANCDACRKEKILAIRMMGNIKETLKPRPLSPAALNVIVDRIAEKSRKKGGPSPAPESRRLLPRVVFPAFAAACLMLVVMGVFSMKRLVPDSSRTSIPVANLNETLQEDDIEVIKNIELLEEFETIQQLVQLMEDQNTPSDEDEQIHGETDGGRKLAYG